MLKRFGSIFVFVLGMAGVIFLHNARVWAQIQIQLPTTCQPADTITPTNTPSTVKCYYKSVNIYPQPTPTPTPTPLPLINRLQNWNTTPAVTAPLEGSAANTNAAVQNALNAWSTALGCPTWSPSSTLTPTYTAPTPGTFNTHHRAVLPTAVIAQTVFVDTNLSGTELPAQGTPPGGTQPQSIPITASTNVVIVLRQGTQFYTTTSSQFAYNLQKVTEHEIGHALGLGHITGLGTPNIMNPGSFPMGSPPVPAQITATEATQAHQINCP